MKSKKTLSILGGRRTGKTCMNTIALIKSLPIPQKEKNRLIKCYFDNFYSITYRSRI